MGFTGDGQLQPSLLDERDRRAGIDSRERRAQRADIPMPMVVPGCNVWESGHTCQLRVEEQAMHHR